MKLNSIIFIFVFTFFAGNALADGRLYRRMSIGKVANIFRDVVIVNTDCGPIRGYESEYGNNIKIIGRITELLN